MMKINIRYIRPIFFYFLIPSLFLIIAFGLLINNVVHLKNFKASLLESEDLIVDFYVTPEIGAKVFELPSSIPTCEDGSCELPLSDISMPPEEPFEVEVQDFSESGNETEPEITSQEPPWTKGTASLTIDTPVGSQWNMRTDYPLYFECQANESFGWTDTEPQFQHVSGITTSGGLGTLTCEIYTDFVASALADIDFTIIASVTTGINSELTPLDGTGDLERTTSKGTRDSELSSLGGTGDLESATLERTIDSELTALRGFVGLQPGTTDSRTKTVRAKWIEIEAPWDERPRAGIFELVRKPDKEIEIDSPNPLGAFLLRTMPAAECLGLEGLFGCTKSILTGSSTKFKMFFHETKVDNPDGSTTYTCRPTQAKVKFTNPLGGSITTRPEPIVEWGQPVHRREVEVVIPKFKNYADKPNQSRTLQVVARTVKDHENYHVEIYRHEMERLRPQIGGRVIKETWGDIRSLSSFAWDGEKFTVYSIPGTLSEGNNCEEGVSFWLNYELLKARGESSDALEDGRLMETPPQSVNGLSRWSNAKWDTPHNYECFWASEENPPLTITPCREGLSEGSWISLGGSAGGFDHRWPPDHLHLREQAESDGGRFLIYRFR